MHRWSLPPHVKAIVRAVLRRDSAPAPGVAWSAAPPSSTRSYRRGAEVEKLARAFGFTEGPVWVPEGYLLFAHPAPRSSPPTPPGATPTARRST